MSSITDQIEMYANRNKNNESNKTENRFGATKDGESDFGEKTAGLMKNWPDEVFATPTEIAKTALFSDTTDGALVENKIILSRNEVSIKFTGRLLNRFDENIWMAFLDLNKGKPIGERIFI